MIVDTHCHLEKELYDNFDCVIKNMNNNIMITAGCNNKSNKELLKLNNKNIYVCLGIHPEEAEKYNNDDINFIEHNINKVVAIGEIGLDYHYDVNKEKQKELFIKQLDLAEKYNKPVIIHSRDAINDTYEILNNYKMKKDIHCFSSSYDMAKKFININCMIGIGGIVTFNNSKKLQDIVSKISLENILLETDSPYLTPEPYRGKKNEPSNVYLVAKKIAELKNISIEEVISVTTRNAFKFFNIDRK